MWINDAIKEVIKNNLEKKIFFFVDIDAVLTEMYVSEYQRRIVESSTFSETNKDIYEKIFFVSREIMFEKTIIDKNLDFNIIFFSSTGKSKYHTDLLKEYKENRKIKDTTLLELNRKFRDIKRINFLEASEELNKYNKVKFVYLNYLESDFVPYYFFRKINFNENIYLFFIYSSDKDFLQLLDHDNIYLIKKYRNINRIYNRSNRLLYFLKSDNMDFSKLYKNIEYVNSCIINLVMSLNGDVSDNIKGVKGFGDKAAYNFFIYNDLKGLISDKDKFEDSIENNVLDINFNYLDDKFKKFFNEENINLIIKNYKLISFEQLYRWLGKKDSLFKIEISKKLDNFLIC